MAKRKVGRPSVPDLELKKVRTVRVSDDGLQRIKAQFGSLQKMIDTTLALLPKRK